MTRRTLADLEAERIAGSPDDRETWLAEFRLVLALVADVMHEHDRQHSTRVSITNRARGVRPPWRQ